MSNVKMMPKRILNLKDSGHQPRKGEMSMNTRVCLKALVNGSLDDLEVITNPTSTPAKKGLARKVVVGVLAHAFGETCTSRERLEIQFPGGKLIWEPNKASTNWAPHHAPYIISFPNAYVNLDNIAEENVRRAIIRDLERIEGLNGFEHELGGGGITLSFKGGDSRALPQWAAEEINKVLKKHLPRSSSRPIHK